MTPAQKQKVLKIILATQNDINEYLMNDSVPIENNAKDVDFKLECMKAQILLELID